MEDFSITFNESMKGKMVKIQFCESFHISEQAKYDLMKNIKKIDDVVFTVSCLLENGTIRIYLTKPFDLIESSFIQRLMGETRNIYKFLKSE